METVFEYTDQTAWISSDQRKWINRIRKLKAAHPAEVEIKAEPETNDGCIYATVPAAWLRIVAPARQNLTEEQKQARAERLRENRRQRNHE